ncbi:transcriptional regulator, LacI family [Bifidobacterium lemurum]|uniref:Transcriptional regulator, LacI family n=1 Tax=Bifidobacterium lemurum TaxID=1603886 RepID=A0A261FWT4_9BIFI|nr:LacI family DNA-binding transcriptional regulator [Bifidobacterium lemurum]OZG63403.1 transcriptional regulator, LacI family [Bifidobacterium lemurum]QOL34308.1 LacI family DNA-binding transcriptional regulator [Bifidobacterium lemurum]
MKKVTIRDVAKAAGVAPSTVSRALSATERVSSETTRRIFEIAERLGYQMPGDETAAPSPALRRLLGIVVPDLTDSYCAAVTHAVEHECFGHGFSLVVAESRGSVSWERMALDGVLRNCDGALLFSPRMQNAQIREYADRLPLVVMGRQVRGVGCAVVDLTTGIGQAASLFAVRGYGRVTYLAGPGFAKDAAYRLKALESACDEHELAVRHLWPGEPTFEGGRAFVGKYLEDPTGAVIAYNDVMALGFMAGMRERGHEAPRDYAIIGFNDDVSARAATPALTSVRMPADALGSSAARLLMRRLEGTGDDESLRDAYVTVPSSLVLRGSVGTADHNERQ